MKKFDIFIIVIIILAGLISLVISDINFRTTMDNAELVYSTKYFSLKTIDELISSDVKIVESYKVVTPAGEFFLVIYPEYEIEGEILFSGPPAAVFDNNKKLVDTSFDVGGDINFLNKWNYENAMEINLKD